MLGNLKNPPEPFKDVIETHFRLKANSIIKQLDKWLTMDDGNPTNGMNNGGYSNIPGNSGSAFQKDAAELKTMLGNFAAARS
jgi:hypothetical protein